MQGEKRHGKFSMADTARTATSRPGRRAQTGRTITGIEEQGKEAGYRLIRAARTWKVGRRDEVDPTSMAVRPRASHLGLDLHNTSVYLLEFVIRRNPFTDHLRSIAGLHSQ
ncbi:hypothetical protein FHL15_003411 [Xylaria flabelliformis]|uniref:Uncharacterized protein n=1 Tax=Xylaria flabelliformis TaxID=2512241 RepID=A0A553I6N4_9PEZI|nr:hypothetical protein FHL15_003411 [Xylaria flabelliformis]